MPRSAIAAIPTGDARLAVTLPIQLVAFVTDTAIDVTQTRLARNPLSRIAVVTVVAFLTAVAAISPRARTALRSIT